MKELQDKEQQEINVVRAKYKPLIVVQIRKVDEFTAVLQKLRETLDTWRFELSFASFLFFICGFSSSSSMKGKPLEQFTTEDALFVLAHLGIDFDVGVLKKNKAVKY